MQDNNNNNQINGLYTFSCPRAIDISGGLLLGMLSPSLPGVMLIWALLGAGSSLIQTPAGRLIVRSSHPGERPAYYAAQVALSHACWLIAYPLAGWVGAGSSLTIAFAIMAAVAALASLSALLFWRRESSGPLLHTHAALHGFFGRQTGVIEGYAFSPALANSEFRWTPDALDAWLAQPAVFLPGNRMAYAGLRKEDDRRAVIAWLLQATADE